MTTDKRVIAFTATWCQPCKNLKPFLNKLGETYPIEFLDLDEHFELAKEHGVRGVPSLVYFEEPTASGVSMNRVQFNPSPKELRAEVEAYYGNPGPQASAEGSSR